MSFFLKGQPRNAVKRKFDSKNKKSKRNNKSTDIKTLDSDNESIESDFEAKEVADKSESEGEYETAQEKKVRLAKKYLEEIVKAEQERNENEELDDAAVTRRLKEDYLEQQGRLHKEVADKCVSPDASDVLLLKCKEHKLSVTCVCISSDGKLLFSGSKCASIVQWDLQNKKKIKSICFKKGDRTNKTFLFHKSSISALAVSTDSKFLVSCEQSNDIQVWNALTLEHLHSLKGHRDHVTGLVFRKDSYQLYSSSKDRSIKVWNIDEMAYVETLYGHQAPITAIDALGRERAITAGGRDCSVRIWKIVEESQLIFNGHEGSIDAVKLIDEEHFISCGDDGSVCIWGNMKKKPLVTVKGAHGSGNWVVNVGTLLYSDLVASGSCDGFVRLWKVGQGARSLTQVLEIPIPGFVNSIVFCPSSGSLIVAAGQEHRLGRWWRNPAAKNAIYVIPILPKDTT